MKTTSACCPLAAMSCLIFVCALAVRAAALLASGTALANRASR